MRSSNSSVHLLAFELGLELTVWLLCISSALWAHTSMHLTWRSLLLSRILRAPARTRGKARWTLRRALRLQLDLVHALTLHLLCLVNSVLREVVLVQASAATLASFTCLRLEVERRIVLLLLTRLTARLLVTARRVTRAALLGRILLELLSDQFTSSRVDLVFQVLVRLIVALRRVDVLILVHRVLQFGFTRRVRQVCQRLVLGLARLNV